MSYRIFKIFDEFSKNFFPKIIRHPQDTQTYLIWLKPCFLFSSRSHLESIIAEQNMTLKEFEEHFKQVSSVESTL